MKTKHLVLVLVLILLPTLLGCAGSKSLVPEKIKIKFGNNQTGAPGELLEKELAVEVLGPQQRGILGGKGSSPPIPNYPVTFTVLDPASGTKIVGPKVVKTDPGGLARTQVRLGRKFGDSYIQASIIAPNGTKKSVLVRTTSGVILENQEQEGVTKEKLKKPFVVKIIDQGKKPVANVPVFFSIEGEGNGAKLSIAATRTNQAGEAFTYLTLGKETGVYHILAEIADPKGRYVARGIKLKAMGLNRNLLLITVLGGLAIFIFGMKLMSEGLQRVAGERLRAILQFFTRNKYVAVFVGTLVTAVIQSSSATTVMTIGFVNAGLLKLTQAIGIIYGANIGTTITAQIIAFKLYNLALPTIALGLIINMLAHRRGTRFWGQVLMGFGFLFLGMMIMSNVLTPLKNSPTFINFFKMFDCSPQSGIMPSSAILWAILIGTIMTAIVQSSSATVGLAMALAGSGLINFWTAVPLILGNDIGTTATALIASLGTNRPAKQTAIAHSLFNIFGTIYMFALFYIPYQGRPIFLNFINNITPGNVFADVPENIERHIAMAHTFFKVFNVIIFLPFIGILATLCRKIIPERKEDEELKIQYLEPHLLDTPSFALQQAIREIAYMTKLSRKNVREAMNCFLEGNTKLASKITRREDAIDNLQTEITDYLVKISQRDLTETDSKLLPLLFHSVNDAERAGDLAENILELAEQKIEKKLPFTAHAISELKEMFAVLEEQFNHAIAALENYNLQAAEQVFKYEEKLNALEARLATNHAQRLERGECKVASGIVFLDLISNLEKIGDRLDNIAVRAEAIIKEKG